MKLSFVEKHIANLRRVQPAVQQEYLLDTRRFLPVNIQSDKKTITWIVNSYVHRTFGGSEYMAHAINTFLVQKGYTVNVIGYWDTDVFEGVNLIDVRDLHKIQEAVGRCHILMSQNFGFPEFTAKLAGQLDKHLVVFLHTTISDWDMSPTVYQQYMNLSKLHVIYNTESVKQFFSLPLQSLVVRPPINKSKLAIDGRMNTYVTLVSAVEHKGGEEFLEISRRMPDTLFLAVGGLIGASAKSIRNIKFIPYTHSMQDIYLQTDIILMPSKHESWGMVGSEAISSGIPVIASPTPGLQENLSYAGLFIPPKAIDEWVNMIRKLKTDRDFYNQISTMCLKRGKEIQLQNATDFDNMLTLVDNIALS